MGNRINKRALVEYLEACSEKENIVVDDTFKGAIKAAVYCIKKTQEQRIVIINETELKNLYERIYDSNRNALRLVESMMARLYYPVKQKGGE